MRQMTLMILVISSYAHVAFAKLVVAEDEKTAIRRQERVKVMKELFTGSNAVCLQAIASSRLIVVSEPPNLTYTAQNLFTKSAALFCIKLGIYNRVNAIIDTFLRDPLCSSLYIEEQLKEVSESVNALQGSIASGKEMASSPQAIEEANINLESALSYLAAARNLRPQDCR